MNATRHNTLERANTECRSAHPPGLGLLPAVLCCRTVMRVTVLRITESPTRPQRQGGTLVERSGSAPSAVCQQCNPTPKAREVCVEIVVTGRNVEVPDHFRVHVNDKVARLERYDHRIVGLEVELFHEPNRRQSKSCQRVEITGRGRKAVARAEACAQDFYTALDTAVAKLEGRLRRSHDRRRVNGRRARVSAARGGTLLLDELPGTDVDETITAPEPVPDAEPDPAPDATSDAHVPTPRDHDEYLPDGDPVPGRVVRRKVHTSEPMTIDEALSHMELVGHDFYLFADVESGEPSVVYRRKGYDYGVIRLGS